MWTASAAALVGAMLLSACGADEMPQVRAPGEKLGQQEALIIGTDVLEKTYGKRTTRGERPIVVEIQGDVWVVHGTLKRGWKGGVAEAHVSPITGEVLSVLHEK